VCKGTGGQWLNIDGPIVKIVAKLLEVILTKPTSTKQRTDLLQRFYTVGVLSIDFLTVDYSHGP